MKSGPALRRRRRWPRRLFWLSFLTGLMASLAGIAALVIYARAITLYFVHQALPQANVQIGSVAMTNWTTVRAERVAVLDSKAGVRVASLDAIDIEFRPWNLVTRRLAAIRLTNLEAVIGPGFTETFTPNRSGTQTSAAESAVWTVDRLQCDYGVLQISELGLPAPGVILNFAFDWRDIRFSGTDKQLRELTIWGLNASSPGAHPGPVADLDLVSLSFSLEGLSRRVVDAISVRGGTLIIGDSLQDLVAAEEKAPPSKPWSVGALALRDVEVRIANLPGNAPDIRLTINTDLQNIGMSDAGQALRNEVHEIVITDFDVFSPRNPTRKVIALPSTTISFTLAGLLRQQIDQIRVVRPRLYVGEDLFWYMDQTQGTNSTADQTEEKAWSVSNLVVYYGTVVLAAGDERVGLPLNFETTAQNVDLGNLAALRLRATLNVPSQDIDLPDYHLDLVDLNGEMRFAYPRDKMVNNLVNTLRLDQLRWRQFHADDLWMAVTFDLNQVHCEFGGKTYSGYLQGGFDFFFLPGSPWTGWVSASGVDCRRLTDILAPQNFRITGPLRFLVEVNGRTRVIERVRATYEMESGGKMEISKLEELLKAIPGTWPAIKASATRVAVETVKDFSYTSAGGNAWYAGNQGQLFLKLAGPDGERNFVVDLHPPNAPGSQNTGTRPNSPP